MFDIFVFLLKSQISFDIKNNLLSGIIQILLRQEYYDQSSW